MANAPFVRPFGEAHLADESRLDPVMAAPGRAAHLEGRRLAAEGLELLQRRRERLLVEAGADLGHVDEAPALVEADVERAEVRARSLGIGVAADDELLASLALDLDPLARAATDVGRGGALGDDALEPRLRRGVVEGAALARDVVAVAHHAEGGHEQAQALLAVDERQAAQVAAVEREAIEEHAHHRHLGPRALHVAGHGEAHPRLEALEGRPALVVEGDDLAVDDEAVHGQRGERARDLRIAPGDDLAGAAEDLDLVAPTLGERADPVVLDLEQPRGVRERLVAQRRQHQGLADAPPPRPAARRTTRRARGWPPGGRPRRASPPR